MYPCKHDLYGSTSIDLLRRVFKCVHEYFSLTPETPQVKLYPGENIVFIVKFLFPLDREGLPDGTHSRECRRDPATNFRGKVFPSLTPSVPIY